MSYEEQLLQAKRTLDLEAFQRLYAEDLLITGVLGECGRGTSSIVDEITRGKENLKSAMAAGKTFETSCENEDVKVAAHGDTVIANYRFVVKIKGENLDVHRRYRATNVWMKRQGRWQIVAAHTAFVLDPGQAAMLSGQSK